MLKVLWRMSLLVLICAMLVPHRSRASVLSPMLTALAGGIPAAVATGQAVRQGSLPDQQALRLAIGLAPANPAAMQAALASIYDPSSPSFHHFLSHREVTLRFGPDPARVSALVSWLTSQGLTPAPWHGGLLLDVRGTAGQIGAAFHTHLSIYQYAVPRAASASPGGRPAPSTTGYAPDTAPLLPTQFAALVSGIAGLSGVTPAHTTAYASAPVAKARSSTSSIGYSPPQVTAAYNFRPLYASGLHGEHLRVAMVELAPYDPSDIAAYFNHYGPGASITSHPVDGGNSDEPANVEATLDLELLGPSVPAASIDVYNAPNDASGSGLLDAYSAVASAGNANVLLLTWVHCEPEAAQIDGFVQVQHTLFQTLALQGTTIVAASGDAGAYGCSDGEVAANDRTIDVTKPVVSLPASDPYVLGVAASDATISSGQATSLIGESAWSCPAKTSLDCAQFGYKGGSSGGGLSTIFRTGDSYGDDLSWQAGPGVKNAASTGYRQVPDVTISGSYGVDPNHDDIIYWQGVWRVGGGTSAAAPFWSALMLLADQYLITHGGSPVGWVNPLLYRLGARSGPNTPFHDITTGSNLLYSATPGWDYASGWGSPDAWLLVRDLTALEIPSLPTPTALPTSGGTVLLSATTTVAPGLTPTPTVALSQTTTVTTPSATSIAQPLWSTGSPTATATPTASLTASATRVSTASSGAHHPPTKTPTPSTTPSRAVTPVIKVVCPSSGIGNGAFAYGTLACWQAGGTTPPHIVANVPSRHRYSVQLGDKAARRPALSVLSQIFLLSPNLKGRALHVNFWLAVSPALHKQGAAGCKAACAAASPAYPRLTVTGPDTRPIAQASLVPGRTGVWSGLRLPLPTCTKRARCQAERLKLSLTLPPQPPGISMVLYVNDIHLGI